MQVLDDESTSTALTPWCRGWRLLVVVAVVATVTHLPGFIRTEVLNPDEAYLATEGQVINDGGRLYHDVVDRKPPVVPYVYAAVQRVTGSDALVFVRLVALGAHVATALLVAAIARRRWGDTPALAAAVLYLVASGGLVLEDGQAANFEVFMLPFMCASVLLASQRRAVASGVAVAVATLSKQVAVTTLLPVGLLVWKRDRLPALARLGVRVTIPTVVVAAMFGWDEFFFWVFTDTGGYLDARDSLAVALGRGAAGIAIFLAANLGASILVASAARRWRDDLDLWLWLLAALAGASAGFRFFGHYFLQLAPPFSLLAAGALVRAKRADRIRTVVLAGASVVAFVALTLSMHPNVLTRYDRLADAIHAQTSPSDRIFVWGQHPQVYWASDRRPATRFLTSGFLTGFSGGRSESHVGEQYAVEGAWDDFEADLAAHPPALIVDESVGTSFTIDRFPRFAAYLSGYERVSEIDGVVLYRRA